MATIWLGPDSGELLNQGQPWRRGESTNIQIVLDTSHPLWFDFDRIEIVGGELPPGFSYNGGNKKITGTLQALPKDKTQYPVVFRVFFQNSTRTYDRSFTFVVDPIDEPQYWLGNPQQIDLGVFNRGSGITIPLNIENPDQDTLFYKAVGVTVSFDPQGFEGLPNGLTIDEQGRIIGSPLVTGNQPGNYYFRVYARTQKELDSNPHGEGDPRTSSTVYKITLSNQIVLDSRLSDTVKWETPQGYLGSTYETYPSHFSVLAVPQYQVINNTSIEVQKVQYTLAPNSGPLPDGLILDGFTGLIIGKCPYVSNNRTYTFTIRARVVFVNEATGSVRTSAIWSDRTFSIMIRNIFATDSVTSVEVNVPPSIRSEIVEWITGNRPELREQNLEAEGISIPASSTSNQLEILSRSQVYRINDPLFGRKRTFKILLASGLYYTGENFLEYLRDYHHPSTWRVGELKSAKARDPEGNHLYDVIYLDVLDPLKNAGGFDANNREQQLPRYAGNRQTAIPQWNLNAQDDFYYPNSIRNLRLDLTQRSFRLSGQTGLGTLGNEGLPIWMTCRQVIDNPNSVLGFQPAIELVYVQPNSGPGLIKILKTAGMEASLMGRLISVDRYLFQTNGFTETTWDLDFSTGELTTWDGPDNLETPTSQMTSWDRQLQSESKYYKFPPGDV